MADTPYYAKGGLVWKAPITTENPDGTKSMSMGFPVATMHECVGDDAAEELANLMNAGHAALNPEETTS